MHSENKMKSLLALSEHCGILSSVRQSLCTPCHTGEGLVKEFGGLYTVHQRQLPYRLSWVCSGHLLLYRNLLPLKMKAPVKPWKGKKPTSNRFCYCFSTNFGDSLHLYVTGYPDFPSLTSFMVYWQWQESILM